MKLCWLVPDDLSGGVASVAQACCRQAVEFGHDVTLLVVISPTGRIKSQVGFSVESLNLAGLAEKTPKTLLQWLEIHPQDVLFLNGCEQSDAAIAYLPNSLRCIYVVHDTARRYWQTAVQQENNIDGIVAVSEAVSQQFIHRLKEPKKLTTILNGCAFPKLTDQGRIRLDNIVFLGGDKPIKGAFDVLTVWQHLVQSGFTGKLHWFGKIVPPFEKRIKSLPDADRLCLYGYASRELVFSTLAKAKIFLMLSRVEPFGMSTIEAMSMGCVPIAWDIETGTKEIVGGSKSGVFVPLGNTEALAQKILEVLEFYPDYKEETINHAWTYFSAPVMGQKYEELVDTVVSQHQILREKAGRTPPDYKAPVRRFQLLPKFIRSAIRTAVGRSPSLGYWLRDLRGL